MLENLVKKVLIKLVEVEVHAHAEGVQVSSTQDVAKKAIAVKIVVLEVEDLCYDIGSIVRLLDAIVST